MHDVPAVGEVWEGEGITVTLLAPPDPDRPGYSDMWKCRLKGSGITYVPADRFGKRLKRAAASGGG